MSNLLPLDLINKTQQQQSNFYSSFSDKQSFERHIRQRFVQVGSRLVDLKVRTKKSSIKDIETLMKDSPFYSENEAKVNVFKGTEKLLRCDTEEYNPYKPAVYHKDGVTTLNSYTPVPKQRKTPTDEFRKIWADYITLLAPIEREKEELLKWLAHNLYGATRSQIALLLYGQSTGTGKGTLQEILTKLHGLDNTLKPSDPEQFILSKFKSELETKTLLILDELYYDGYKVSNKSKSLITETTLDVEPKGEALRKVCCYYEMVVASNYEQPLWLSSTDRRWFCLNVKHDNPIASPNDPSNTRSSGIARRMRALLDGDSEDVLAMIRSLLAEVDLTEYVPQVDGAYKTEACKSLISSSSSIPEAEFNNVWDEEAPINDYYFNATKWFDCNLKETKLSAAKKKSWLLDKGCIPFSVGSDTKSRQIKLCDGGSKNGLRDWWITPLGFEVGIKEDMTAKKILSVVEEHKQTLIDDATPLTIDYTFEEVLCPF